MNYLEEQTDGEAMINSIQNDDQPLPVIAQVSLAGNAQNAPPTLKDPKFWTAEEKKTRKIDPSLDYYSNQDESRRDHGWFDNADSVIVSGMTAEEKKTRKIDRLARSLLIQGLPNDIYSLIDSNETTKDLWDALERQMRGSEYGEQDKKAAILYEYETLKAIEGEQLLDTYLRYLQQNQGDVNDALGYKKKAVVVTSDPLASVAEKTKVSKQKEKVVVSSDSEDCKKAKVKDYNYYKTKMLLAKKDSDEQVLLDEDQAWMESKSDESSSSAEEAIAEVSYYTSESESESEFETLEYYDNFTNYGLFVNDNDDQEIFHDAIESASENFIENHIDSQKDYDKSKVDHNDSEEKEHLIDKLIRKFNHKIAKCQKNIEKANQQSKDLENQNKNLQEKYDVLLNQVNTFEKQNNEFNEQIKVLNEKNADLFS
nr:hypothetical protein [Tanacetum cinerariifolium]